MGKYWKYVRYIMAAAVMIAAMNITLYVKAEASTVTVDFCKEHEELAKLFEGETNYSVDGSKVVRTFGSGYKKRDLSNEIYQVLQGHLDSNSVHNGERLYELF